MMTIHEIDISKRPNSINVENINTLMKKLNFNLYTKSPE